MNPQEQVIADVVAERNRQDAKWGVTDHSPFAWCAILTEEVGEFAQGCLHKTFSDGTRAQMREEAVQVAAVAVAIIESIDRQERKDPS